MYMYINMESVLSLLLCISQEGNSPLHFAALSGNLHVVKLLIQNGASSTQCNNVSVIVKQVIHVPLCAHVQVRYMVIFVCLCISTCMYMYVFSMCISIITIE